MIDIHYDSHMGCDLSVVNAARASFGKETHELRDRDKRLIRFLAREAHESPFRHGFIRFVVRSTYRDRVMWETGPANHPYTAQYRAGMAFMPSLTELAEQVSSFDDMVEWRWTASVQAVARFIQLWKKETNPFPLTFIFMETAKRFPATMCALMGNPEFESAIDKEPQRLREALKPIPVLDLGYVRLVDWMDGPTEPEAVMTFEIRAPQMVRAQWFKYRVESEHLQPFLIDDGAGNGDDGGFDDWAYSRNEMSGRYEPPIGFYVPKVNQWRSRPLHKKQGSGGPLGEQVGQILTGQLRDHLNRGYELYQRAVEEYNAAPEQARIFYGGAAAYTTWRWTCSMAAVNHFLRQRLAKDAQKEINEYAWAVYRLVSMVLPHHLRLDG